VQSEIARTVAQTLSLQLGAATPQPGGTANVSAYENFLRGRELFAGASSEADDRAALAQFDLAIAADPKFALAHAARSRSLSIVASEYSKGEDIRAVTREAVAAARRSVAIAPDLPQGNLALGYALYAGQLDIRGARPFYDRAYKFGSGDADIVLLFALYCSRAGRAEEAQRAVARSVALDPLNPRAHRAQGSIIYAARRYAEALAPLRRALALKPDLSNTHSYIGAALLMSGKVRESLPEFAAETNRNFGLAGIAIARHKLGEDKIAVDTLGQMRSELGDSSLYQQAEVLAQMGRPDEAFETLLKAKKVGDSGLIYLATDPLLDPLRGDPRFAVMERSLALV
jgi:tetratricopeptide (TPR) repeat protein